MTTSIGALRRRARRLGYRIVKHRGKDSYQLTDVSRNFALYYLVDLEDIAAFFEPAEG